MVKGAWLGLGIILLSQAATFARIEPFWSWNTPIAWTGFILFADSIVFSRRGDSWIRSAPREFVCLSIASIPLWLVFEFYNLFIQNWYYVGLPQHRGLRYFGYAWSFATIWPAIFEGAELIAVGRERLRRPSAAAERDGAKQPAPGVGPRRQEGGWGPVISVGAGALMLAVPLVWSSRYLAAPVWLGFIFLLDPINRRLGGESLARDFQEGRLDRCKNLILSGFLCGILWEFWNYWARAKWHYSVPIMETLKVFEMPVPGYFGFPAFAVECFAMYVFLRLGGATVVSAFRPGIGGGRTIAL
jgi:hypothetical protein